MISPKAIRKQAENWWPEVLRASLTGTDYFPKALTRIGKVKARDRLRDFDRIRTEQRALLAECKTQTGKGYRLHWRERNFRDIGPNRFIERITIDSLDDYLHLLRRSAAHERFLADAALIRNTFPALRAWCIDHPLEVEAHHDRWPDLLRVLRYFREDHQPGRYYIRELPISVPTKFIESHPSILSSLLDALLPPDRINQAYRGTRHFEQRYGLKYRQPTVRIRLLDDAIANEYFSGLSDLQLPLDDFATLQLPLERAIILENKTNFANLMNFLTLPLFPKTAGIFGSGFSLGNLKGVDWLHQLQLLYWGDLDAHGLQILSQLRGYFPQTQAFLMDRPTLDAFPQYVLQNAPQSSASVLEHLTDSEQALFDYLNTNRLRLEQERIPVWYVQQRLTELDRATSN